MAAATTVGNVKITYWGGNGRQLDKEVAVGGQRHGERMKHSDEGLQSPTNLQARPASRGLRTRDNQENDCGMSLLFSNTRDTKA